MSNNYSYPEYTSNPPITATVYQCGEEIDWGDKITTISRSYIGPDDDILAMAKEHHAGTSIVIADNLSGIVKSCKTTKIESDRTKLTYVVQKGNEDDDDPNIIDETWQVTMAQMDVPLYRYCSPSASISATDFGNSTALNAWEQGETMDKLAYKFRSYNPSISQWEDAQPLSGRTLEIAHMIAAGTEARLVFYPQATRVTTCIDYTKIGSFDDRINALNWIDDTPSTELDLGNVSYTWLKSAFDIQQLQDGSWTVTETWIGTPEYLGQWRPELYDYRKHWEMYVEQLSS